MRKVSAIIIAVLLLTVSLMPMTALAKGNPELMLAAYFNDEADTITVYYRVLNFLGTESADFRLRFNPDVVEYVENEKTKMSDVLMEIGVLPPRRPQGNAPRRHPRPARSHRPPLREHPIGL